MSRRMNWEKANSRSADTGKRAHELPATQKQIKMIGDLSRQLGTRSRKPKSMLDASQLIQQLMKDKKRGVARKNRRPAVPIKGRIPDEE